MEAVEVNDYYLEVLNVKHLKRKKKDISTQNEYKYYIGEALSVCIYQSNQENLMVIRDFQIFESLKMYIYNNISDNNHVTDNEKKTLEKHLWLEYVMNSSKMPIASINVIDFLKLTKTYQRQEKSIELKIELLNVQNNDRVNRNSFILNIMLYVLTIISSIEPIVFLENKFNIPIKYSLPLFILLFGIWGIYLHFQSKK